MRTERHRPCFSTNSLSSCQTNATPHSTFQHNKNVRHMRNNANVRVVKRIKLKNSHRGVSWVFLRFGHAHSKTHFFFLWSTNFSCLALPSCLLLPLLTSSPSIRTFQRCSDFKVESVIFFKQKSKEHLLQFASQATQFSCRTCHSSLF